MTVRRCWAVRSANGSGAWSYTTAALAEGAHTFTSTAADAAGNTSGASAGLTVTIDTKKPNAPVLASDVILTTNQVLLTGTAEANSTVNVFDGDNGARYGNCERQWCLELYDQPTFGRPPCFHCYGDRYGGQYKSGFSSL